MKVILTLFQIALVLGPVFSSPACALTTVYEASEDAGKPPPTRDDETITRRSAGRFEQPQADWSEVDKILGRTTTTQPDGVRRYGFPRSDLTVTAHGVPLKAGFALGGYASFTLSEGMDAAVVMGDLVLTEDEINPVMTALQEGRVETTAIHNHLLFETPRVMYLHFKGEGNPAEIAEVLYTALSQTKTPLIVPATGATKHRRVYQYIIGRAETITDGDMALYTGMGAATIINFQPVGDTDAAVTGDFSLIATEVPLVLRALSGNGIQVNALHSHMLTDSPRIFYAHFWGVDDALELACGLREAVSMTNSTKPSV